MPDDSPRTRAKREQIMAAARQLFLTHGYQRTSTEAIRRAAGVSKQTLYVYFPGKVELLSATVMQELAGLAFGGSDGLGRVSPQSFDMQTPDIQTPDIQTLSDLRARLLELARTFTGRLMRPDALALLRLLIGEAIQLPELRGVLRLVLPARLLSGVEALLSAAHRADLVDAPDPHLSARMFVGPVISFVALDGLFGDGAPVPPDEATLARLVDLFLRTVSRGGEV